MNEPRDFSDVSHVGDLLRLDKDVARAVKSLRAARLSRNEDLDPFAGTRHVAGKSTFVALEDRPWSIAEAPHAAALRRWVYALTIERLAHETELARSEVTEDEKAPVVGPKPRTISFREAIRGVVFSAKRNEAQSYLRTAGELASQVAPLNDEVASLRREAAHRLGQDDAPLFETGVKQAALTTFADDFFRKTDALATDILRAARKKNDDVVPLAADWFFLAEGRDAREGWPSHLTRRWLEEFAPPLVRGLNLDVAELPKAVGASSFARALAEYGRAVRRAGPSPSLPFALAQDPFAIDSERYAFVFAALIAAPAFHRVILGNVARVAAQQARVGAIVLLFTARLAAVQWLRAHPGTTGDSDELGHRLLDAPPPGDLFTAWPSGRSRRGEAPNEASRLVALGTSTAFVSGLIERHDEDWFKNPRGLAELRARAAAPAILAEDPFDGATQANALVAHFEQALA